MKGYIKLVNFEFNRVAKLFAILLGITLVVQIAGVIVKSRKYMSMANERIYEELVPKAQFIEQFGKISFLDIGRTIWFAGPIALCVAGVAFYIFFTWYRDWFGKNTFIYRLLMLPTTRLNIFFAKITNILLMVFGLVAFQLLLLPVETAVLKWMVPKDFRTDMGVKEIVTSMPELNVIIPSSVAGFALSYAVGVLAVSILFTAILLERSFKWKGVFAGILYSVVAVAVLISPLLLQNFVLDGFFYPLEVLALEIVTGLIVLAGSIWMSGFLLKKKITV